MKKVISVILSMIMAVSLVVCVFAESEVSLSLNDETVYAGEEFVINLFISDNSQMSGAVIDLLYDKSMLEFVSAKEGAILDSSANVSIRNNTDEEAYVRFTYLAPSSSVTSAGILLSITFKALETAKGNTNIDISIANAGDFVTLDLKKISYTSNNSVIKIINTENDVVESEENSSELQTEHNIPEKSTENQQVENNHENYNDKNNYDLIIVALLVVGAVLISVSVVVFSKKKKRR